MVSVDKPGKTKAIEIFIMKKKLQQTTKYWLQICFYFDLRNGIIKSIQRASFIAILMLFPFLSLAQDYDLLLKGGRVIDAKNKINAQMDLLGVLMWCGLVRRFQKWTKRLNWFYKRMFFL